MVAPAYLKGVQVLNPRQLLRNGPVFLLLSLTVLLSACGSQPAPAAPCNPETLGAAANLAPHDVVLDASKPVTLSWTYSDPTCMPDHF